MTPQEEALVMTLGDAQLPGILAQTAGAAETGVVVVVGGPQTRVGSHRQFVLLARHLARAGFPTLRFDHRGIGDADGEARSFETIADDVRLAMDTLWSRVSGLRRLVLWGLCDGASAILLHAASDPRVGGLVLLNPWVRNPESEAQARLRHYYRGRLLSREFWRRLLSGRIHPGASLRNWARTWRLARTADPGPARGFIEGMESGWRAFEGPVLLILAEGDMTAQEFVALSSARPEWRRLLQRPAVQRVNIAGADHTFSTQVWRDHVTAATRSWLEALPGTGT